MRPIAGPPTPLTPVTDPIPAYWNPLPVSWNAFWSTETPLGRSERADSRA